MQDITFEGLPFPGFLWKVESAGSGSINSADVVHVVLVSLFNLLITSEKTLASCSSLPYAGVFSIPTQILALY